MFPFQILSLPVLLIVVPPPHPGAVAYPLHIVKRLLHLPYWSPLVYLISPPLFFPFGSAAPKSSVAPFLNDESALLPPVLSGPHTKGIFPSPPDVRFQLFPRINPRKLQSTRINFKHWSPKRLLNFPLSTLSRCHSRPPSSLSLFCFFTSQ